MIGKIRTWSRTRRFAWIETQDGAAVFLHLSDIASRETLRRGTAVEFKPVASVKGLRATQVQVVPAGEHHGRVTAESAPGPATLVGNGPASGCRRA